MTFFDWLSPHGTPPRLKRCFRPSRPWALFPRLIALLALPLILAGCWDAREIDRRAFVFVMGIDWQEDTRSFRITAVIAHGQTEGEGSSSESQRPLKAEGRTIADSMERLAALTDRTLDWGNLRTIVFGESLARQGVSDALRAPLGLPRVPGDVILLQARGSAGEALGNASGKDPAAQAQLLQKWLENYQSKTEDHGLQLFHIPAWQFRSWLRNGGQDPYLGGVPLPGEAGATGAVAIFQQDRLTGWVDPDEAVVLGWTLGRSGGQVVIPDPDNPSRLITLRIRNVRVRRQVTAGTADRLSLSLWLRAEAWDTGPGGRGWNALTGTVASALDRARRIQRAAEKHILTQATELLSQIQTNQGSDIWGFGETARRSDPGGWNPLHWQTRFRHAVWHIEPRISLSFRNRFR